MSRGGIKGATAAFAAWTPVEDATLRAAYVRGGYKAALLALPSRSKASVLHRANRLGVQVRRRWTKADDAALGALWELGLPLATIARELKRSPCTTYWRAQKLGLSLGCPPGFEYLSAAAERTGYCTTQLRPILAWAGVKLRTSLGRPTGAHRRFHIVDPVEVDDALERWHATEPVQAAARRVGVSGDVLRRRLAMAGVQDRRTKKKQHWRVRADEVACAIRK